ncbi:OLC1v1015761C1 [Oldenlandia corymbosa var. corymbosa]|uniref:OLC1v1015761C1 n=1 Tax=Oldenlandia corymbosa var. corymbosa TaxID=529605 RepID=A0AAV1E3Y3_OLDCO|nr:OLC1v1015761C1 [Oldenlandia corymbosa var. corymbosa]
MASSAVDSPLLSNSDIVEGNVDFKGRQVRRSESGRWRSASFIIGVEMAERFAYSGISANLITYLTGPLGQSTAAAAKNVNAWDGTAALLPLAGAFIADSFLGRYCTIIVASVLYILALGSLTLSATLPIFKSCEYQVAPNVLACSPAEIQVAIFFFSLYLVAIAQGMHKPCVQAFGADQFDGQNPEEAKAKSSFFNWWYLSMCASITVTLVILTYIQENFSWGLGFGIPCLVMLIALILFLLGTNTYRFHVQCDESNPYLRIVRVFIRAAKNWRTTPSELERQRVHSYLGSQHLKFLNQALLGPDGSREQGEVCNISEVEEAKAVVRLFPILATCLVYGIVYSQSSTLFTKQGVTMDRYIGQNFQVPAASLQSLITLSIVVFVLLYDRSLVPIARAVTGKPSGITMLQRIGTGLLLSCLTMIIAASVEKKRLNIAQNYALVDEPNAPVPLSIVWLIPQYLFLGVSESLTMVGLQEFFYNQVPSGLKSTGLALYLSIFGVGGFLSSFLISVIEKATGGQGSDSWFSDNLNKAHLDYFYWLLAGLSAVAFIAFLLVAKSYSYN